ncbi:MAG TPA: DUF2119 domain-containing protein [Methanothermobacter sp.]|nr:conserved hypothetical protein [Methanothermobacter sp. MT-2]HHW05719.1 DUF2119 domain-containing protein [Methanothermobacter sp.]HOK72966.1 DUF2119 domain-containing protein [Methanothermobacter sp.]HOL69272.1 DUF2119 domain-containing protein [Methanothermobacter sp.]HPQ04490.1 DUF2119 domain-containing protein [Methanothermobacter sp.]
MSFFRLIKKGDKPRRLFIGGLHGREGLTTIKALKMINFEDVKSGELIIYNCNSTTYLSTLKRSYYNTRQGKEILSLIEYYKPSIYVEAHCYKDQNYERLIDPERKKKIGVPPLIEMENGVLIGSVSPHIRTSLFKRWDVCITLEMPCILNGKAFKTYASILRVIASIEDRPELEEKLGRKYPRQVEIARRYAREFFGDYPPF